MIFWSSKTNHASIIQSVVYPPKFVQLILRRTRRPEPTKFHSNLTTSVTRKGQARRTSNTVNFHRLGAPNSPAPPVTRIGQARRATNSVNFHRLGAPNSPAPRCSFSKNTLGKTKNPDRREHCCRIQFGWELRVRLGPPLFDTRRKPKLAFSLLFFSFSFFFSKWRLSFGGVFSSPVNNQGSFFSPDPNITRGRYPKSALGKLADYGKHEC